MARLHGSRLQIRKHDMAACGGTANETTSKLAAARFARRVGFRQHSVVVGSVSAPDT